MKSFIYASAALAATAAAQSVGSAVVVNKCTYDVYVAAVPASDGGYTEVDKTLSQDGNFTQEWTQLSNTDGWSIKLSKVKGATTADILQYEYTFHNDGTIWYDLSEVNGNPWDGDWEITADQATCAPKQSAYRYATDDAYGMQSCPQDATITVTLCSGESQDDSGAASASSSAAAESTAASSTNASAPTSSSESVSSTPASTTAAPSTTLQTSVITTSSADNGNEVVVTVTEVATATAWTHAWGSKRDTHQHRHAARHPHHRN